MDTPTPDKPRRTAAEKRLHKDARLRALSLRYAISTDLDSKGITSAGAVGEAMGMPGESAAGLLKRKHLLDRDLEQLEAAAARLGIQVPP
jgi:hypothetical protein